MPAHQLLPDGGTLLKLRSEGKTYDEIAAIYGVTRGAVYLQLSRIPNAVDPRPNHREVLPWRIRLEHQHAYPAMMLRLLSRRRQGRHLTEEKARMLDSWLRQLDEKRLVVDYDPDKYGPNPASPARGGFAYVARTRMDKRELPVRFPEVAQKLTARSNRK